MWHCDATFDPYATPRAYVREVKFTVENGECEILLSGTRSANHQNFANIVPAQKELARDKILEQIFNMAVVKDSL